MIGGLSPIFEFNDGIGKLVVNSPDGRMNAFALGVGVEGADENFPDWSIASINSSDGGELPIMATEDGARESFRGGPGGVLGGADKFLGGGPWGVGLAKNRLFLGSAELVTGLITWLNMPFLYPFYHHQIVYSDVP